MPWTAAQQPLVLPTAVCGYVLRQLGPCDEALYWRLVDANRRHLGRHGDDTDLQSATPEPVRAALVTEREGHLRRLGWLAAEAVGRLGLIARDPGQFVIAYWLAEAFTGRGLATVACAALLRHAKTRLGATDASAGVTKGNRPSAAVLTRPGFDPVADMGHYVRYHRARTGPLA
jgi:RimJ/RimL family protein N-acetyltransferase